MKRTWLRPISINDRNEDVLRLTDAKSMLPHDAFVTGEAADPMAPPPGLRPIEIEWGHGKQTKHFIREDTNRYMITHRTEIVLDFYMTVPGAGRQIAITQMGSHKFLITAVEQ